MTEAGLFHYPELSGLDLGIVRTPGPGLGNLLFPISRALIGARRRGGTFVHPTMRQVKIGTFLRRERDKRTYGDVIRPRLAAEWRDWAAARRRPKVAEDAADLASRTGATVVYSGLRRHFHDLAGERELIARWLERNMRPAGLIDRPYDIAVHIRQGDFSAADGSKGKNVRQPLDWYVEALAEARRIAQTASPHMMLFTDGDIDALKRTLGMPSIEVDPSGNALAAITNLSKARVLVTSRSTFSMWAAYLGSMPAIWDRAFDLEATFPGRGTLDIRI